jgi:hypothetical protein
MQMERSDSEITKLPLWLKAFIVILVVWMALEQLKRTHAHPSTAKKAGGFGLFHFTP